jgi:hypothetical protein
MIVPASDHSSDDVAAGPVSATPETSLPSYLPNPTNTPESMTTETVSAASPDDEPSVESPDSEPHSEYLASEFIVRVPPEPELDLPKPPPGRDYRLYMPKHSGWTAVIKESWEQEHCYAKNPGEEWFHLLANGEIFVQRGAEKYCLTCAVRHKILTRNRLFWQKGSQGPVEDEPATRTDTQ